jgi:amidase
LYEFKANLNGYLESLGSAAPVKSLRELIAFNEKNKDRELAYFGQERFLAAEAKGPLTSAAYLRAVETNRRLAGVEGIDALMDRYKLDAIVAPSNGPAWLIDLDHGDHYGGGSSSPAAVAGYPNITVPCGFVGNLPIGISFFGRALSEGPLIRIAFAYEQLGMSRKPPKFLQTESL